MKRMLLFTLLVASLVFNPMTIPISLATGEKSKEEKKLEQLEKNQETTEKNLDASLEELNKYKAEVNKIETEIEKLDQEIEELNKKKVNNEQLLKKQRKQLEDRVVSLYKNGEMGFMVQLLEAENFSQFLARLQGIRLIVKNDNAMIEEFKKTKSSIDQATAQITKAKKEQEPLLAKAEEKMKKVNEKVVALKSQISKIKHDVEATKEQIAAKNAAVRQATAGFNGNFGSGRLMKPAAGQITSGFGYRWGRPHEGIDISEGRIGTPIYAADSGVVTLIKSNPGGYGIYIVVSHGNGLSTLYAHMYRNQVLVSTGQRVKKGQQIAAIGNNGQSTGPHLHFEVHKNGKPVNPMPYIQ